MLDIQIAETTPLPDFVPFYLIALSNQSALEFPVAAHIRSAISKHLLLSEAAAMCLESALQEGLLNAVIHGNLGIQSDYTTTAAMESHFREIEHKLQLSHHLKQHVIIEIHHLPFQINVRIRDQGNGFDYKSFTSDEIVYSGRGLSILKSLTNKIAFEDQGRTLSFTLSLYNESSSRIGIPHFDMEKRLLSSNILIVDDSEFNCILIQEIFKKRGFHQITIAHDGQEALEKIRVQKPDIILLDLMMPNMDGFEFCSHVRKLPEISDLPILVQTAVEDAKTRNMVFDKGASDLVTKPIDSEEMIARTILHLERQFLLKDLLNNRLRVSQELDQAREMQNQLMPSYEVLSSIRQEMQIGIAHYFETSSEIGGDFWGVRKLDADHVAMYICDFSGHGITAALNTFRLHALLQEIILANGKRPDQVLRTLNHHIYPLINRDQFCTVFYGVVNTRTDTLDFASAGAPSPLIWNPINGVQRLDSSGVPIGAWRDSQYDLRQVSFQRRDFLLLYSDAMTETLNHQHTMIDENDLIALLDKMGPSIGGNLMEQKHLDTVLKYFRDHTCGPLTDDLTLNVYVRY
jgi:sigma-B regulation protein RsbU (phosphoserine phosphatase)